ncbi:MAG: arylsulfotransferase family protein, partial [Solirubrobacteraceae bacterium]
MMVWRRSVHVLVVLVAALAWGAGGALAAGPAVAVFPTPGSIASLPGTQIVFRGIPAGSIGQVQVVGSTTGSHTGQIEADSDGQGASVVPARPFAAGEKVTVTTGLNIIGSTNGAFSFTVATPWGSIEPAKIPLVPAGSNGVAHFASRPDLQPPSVAVTKNVAPATTGDIFVAPQEGPAQNGPMILDPSGNLVWFHPLPANQIATDFRVQQLGSQPVLTWWEGYTNDGSGRGQDVIFNTDYQQIAVVHAADGLQGSDLHEFLLTPQGDAYIVAVSPLHWDHMTRPLMDSVIQEIDVKTGLVLFEWHALDHIPLSESFFKTNAPGYVYDPYHINSVSLDADGNLLVSLRDTWAVYKINHQTGAVIWTLGSNRNNFKLGAGTATAFQHDFNPVGDGTFMEFDDGAGPPTVHSQSRALRIAVNTSNMTATLVRQYTHAPALSSNFEGSAQLLPSGDVFVGWGQQPYFSEFNA